ncbi:hypothetical protein [Desulfonema magnum]|uniref:Uncharacterized protein n=1 Tax=Desulfonema magnum TaxID=45655 RepID=A0A975BH34_9BACT|nr:hypothetical protein [Desulfonema magnum]QTA84925.1 Uncharacterized protein dnm_009280 [Desulfonema magnum]
MDEKCFEDYATKLLPRAVEHSADLLDYFFRGRLEITLPDSGAYSVIPCPESLDEAVGFHKITLRAENVSLYDEEMTGGKLTVVLKYRLSKGNPFQNSPPPTSEEFYYVTGKTADGLVVPRNSPGTFEIPLSGSVPLWATPR